MKKGLIDVGGGMRGIYGAGVMDRFMDEGILADVCVGVSAGAANLASYLAGQRGRNYRFYMDYSGRWQYMGIKSMLRSGNYINLEYIYGDALTNSAGEDPLNFSRMKSSPSLYVAVATDADSGKPLYFTKDDMEQDDYGAVKGSSCVPLAARPYEWKGYRLFDGGISDPIPFEKALEMGCEKTVLVLTRPKDYFRKPFKDRRMSRLLHRRYPAAAEALTRRAELYNSQLGAALALEREGMLKIVAPDSIEGMKTLRRDERAMRELYGKGYTAAAAAIEWLTK